MRALVRAAALASLLAAAACGRKHLTPAFGTANRDAFQAQRVRAADEPTPRPNMKLDSQETGVLSETYLRGLAGKSGKAEPDPVLYVAPQQPGGGGQRLAPSVPKD